MNELMQAIEELEAYKRHLQREHGENLYLIKDADGKPLVEPVLIALANGYAALYSRGVI